jgi:hypothetical protein
MKSSSPQIFLHIGTHKTGSTAIQKSLLKGKEKLRDEKIVYLSQLPARKNIETLSVLDSDIISSSREFFLRKIAPYPASTRFVMSYEGYSGDVFRGYLNSEIVAESLRRITEGCEVEIIVFLRRQDLFIESMYTQTIHQGQTWSFNDFLTTFDNSSFNWYLLLSNYAKYFYKSRITVRRYEKKHLMNQNSVVEFAHIIDSNSLKSIETNKNPNSGYTRDALELARLCLPHLSKTEKRKLRNILQATNTKPPFENHSFFNLNEREVFLSNFDYSNALIAKEYFLDSSVNLFSKIKKSDYQQEDYRGLTLEAAIDVVIRMVSGLPEIEESKRISVMRKITDAGRTFSNNFFNRFPRIKQAAKYLLEGE